MAAGATQPFASLGHHTLRVRDRRDGLALVEGSVVNARPSLTSTPGSGIRPLEARSRSVAMRRVAMTVTVVLALAPGANLTTLAQSGHCDPYLLVSPTNPFGYRIRGDR